MDLINCLPKVLKKTEWSKTFLKKIHFVCKIRTLFMKTGRRNDVKGHIDHRISCCNDVMAHIDHRIVCCSDVMTILTAESFAAMM